MRPGAVVATALACLPASEAASGDMLRYHSQHSLIQCLYPLWGLLVGIFCVFCVVRAFKCTAGNSRSIVKTARSPCARSFMFFLLMVRLAVPNDALGNPRGPSLKGNATDVPSSAVPSNEVSPNTTVECYLRDIHRVCNLSGAHYGRYAASGKIAQHTVYFDFGCGAQDIGDFSEVYPGTAVYNSSFSYNNSFVVEGNQGKGSLHLALSFWWLDAYQHLLILTVSIVAIVYLWTWRSCIPSGQKNESTLHACCRNPPPRARQRRCVRTKGRRPSPIHRFTMRAVTGHVFSTWAERKNKTLCKCTNNCRCTVSVSKTQYHSIVNLSAARQACSVAILAQDPDRIKLPKLPSQGETTGKSREWSTGHGRAGSWMMLGIVAAAAYWGTNAMGTQHVQKERAGRERRLQCECMYRTMRSTDHRNNFLEEVCFNLTNTSNRTERILQLNSNVPTPAFWQCHSDWGKSDHFVRAIPGPLASPRLKVAVTYLRQRLHGIRQDFGLFGNYSGKVWSDRWRPGEASHRLAAEGIETQPGPPPRDIQLCLTNLTGGGRLRADDVASYSCQLNAITELDLAENAITNFSDTLREGGKTAIYGAKTVLAP